MSENRKQIWTDYLNGGGIEHRIVRHMFLDYSRYFEAQCIAQWFIQNNIKLDFPILDYGCGVGDYGIHLLRNGAKDVDMYDFPRATELVKYRMNLEKLDGKAINADTTKLNLKRYNFIIFGEVLEHLDQPYKLLKQIVDNGTQYIFTSSYPYRTDDPEDPYWHNHDHDDDARLQQPQCRELLEKNYDYTKFDGELRLWVKK